MTQHKNICMLKRFILGYCLNEHINMILL